MSKYGNSYSGNNFLEWWKTHYGTDYDGTSEISKTDSMTEEDFAIGQQLYANYQEEQRLTNEYNTNVGDLNAAANSAIESSNDTYDILLKGAADSFKTGSDTLLKNYTANSDAMRATYEKNSADLLKNYETAQGALDDSKRQSQQNASITLDKLKKYLPSQIKAQGLGGLGVSESSMLQAYNNYNSEMGAIESGYQQNKSALDAGYNENKTSLDNQHSAAQTDLETNYNTAQGNLESGYNETKAMYEGKKAEAEGGIKQQLQADLTTLLQNYNASMGNVGKGADGKLLVDGVLGKYAEMLAADQDLAYDTALSLILQAIHADEASMNAIVEGFRGKVRDDQLAALFEQGKVTAAGNLSKEHGTNYTTALEAIRGAKYTTTEEMNAFVEQYRGKVSDEQLNALFREGVNVAQTNASIAEKEENDRVQEGYKNTYATALENIGSLHFTSQDEMDKHIEQYRGKVTESQFNDLVSRGQTVVAANIKAENDRIANEDKATKDGQYKTEANNIEVMYQSMIADDGKISQADYDKLAAYVTEKGTPLGNNYLALLNSQLNGYKGTVRDQASQEALDKQTAMSTPTVNSGITIDGSLNTANDDYGDNFKISYNGTTYKVEKGYDASDNLNRKLMDAYTSSTGTAPAKGAVMIYDGRIYMYLENNDANQDRWCVVQQRKNTYASHFANLCAALGLTVYSRDYKDG